MVAEVWGSIVPSQLCRHRFWAASGPLPLPDPLLGTMASTKKAPPGPLGMLAVRPPSRLQGPCLEMSHNFVCSKVPTEAGVLRRPREPHVLRGALESSSLTMELSMNRSGASDKRPQKPRIQALVSADEGLISHRVSGVEPEWGCPGHPVGYFSVSWRSVSPGGNFRMIHLFQRDFLSTCYMPVCAQGPRTSKWTENRHLWSRFMNITDCDKCCKGERSCSMTPYDGGIWQVRDNREGFLRKRCWSWDLRVMKGEVRMQGSLWYCRACRASQALWWGERMVPKEGLFSFYLLGTSDLYRKQAGETGSGLCGPW